MKIIIIIAALIISDPVSAASEDTCWRTWFDQQIAMQPKPDDKIDARTGKVLSQTHGAIRTRARKLQARKDELTLRGKDDPKWIFFKKKCVIGN